MSDDSDDSDCLVIDTDPEELQNNEVVNLKSNVVRVKKHHENLTCKETLFSKNGVEQQAKCRNNIRIKVKLDDGADNKVRRFIQSNNDPYMNMYEISFIEPLAVSAPTTPNNFMSVEFLHRSHQNIATVVNCDVTTIANNNIRETSSAFLKITKPNVVLTPSALQPKHLLYDGHLQNNVQRFGHNSVSSLKNKKDFKGLRRLQRLTRFSDNAKSSVRARLGFGKMKKKIEKKKWLAHTVKNNVNIKNEYKQIDSKLTISDKVNTPASVEEKGKEKRMIIIDGSNVAFAHGQTNFSVKGIELCLEHFERQGFQVKAICPQMRVKHNQSTDPTRLEVLVRQKRVLLTPCKHLPGNYSTSYDDRFILEIAASFDAAIISNDNFVDLLNVNPEWKDLIEKRVIGYLWCNDKLFLPLDPYGRNGPSLENILYKEKATPPETAAKVQEKRNITFP